MRTLGTNMLNALTAQQTSEAILVLLTINHDDLSEPIRITSDAVPTISNGNTFVVYPYKVTLPDDPENGFSSGRLEIDNVHRDIVVAIRQISTSPTVTIQIVLGSDPDTVEVEIDGFQMDNIKHDVFTVRSDLVMDNYMHEPFPGNRFVPSFFPGLF